MAKNKTAATAADVSDFVNAVANEQQREDSAKLIEWMRNVSGYEPVLWGPNIIGFGRYHYKYASGHEGDAPLIGFSPRKAAISLYVFTGLEEQRPLLDELGKFTMGKVCIYAKKLSDLNENALVALMKSTIDYLAIKYGKV